MRNSQIRITHYDNNVNQSDLHAAKNLLVYRFN
jgi:hypothetical protein